MICLGELGKGGMTMPFWKKASEDPWERKPEKKPTAPAPALERPEWARTKEPPAPVCCPWCGAEMCFGNLYSGMQRSAYMGLFWREGAHKSFLESIGKPAQDRYLELGAYEEAWYCEDCKKMTMDIGLALENVRPNYVWKDGKVVFPEEEAEE